MIATSPRLIAAFLVAVLALAAAPAAAEDYHLHRGDVLRLVVAGAAGLREEVAIDIDGRVTLPLAGTLPAEGRTLDDLARDVRAALSGAALQVVGEGGRPAALRIDPSAVALSVAAYRPVYVEGDVRAPGAFDFAPGLSARRAIALAGGLGLSGQQGADLDLVAADVEGELVVAQTRLASAEQRAERLRALIADPQGEAGDRGAGGAGDLALGGVEGERLRLARAILRDGLARTEREAQSARERERALREQLALEQEGLGVDQAEYDRLRALQESGRITADRLADARRSLLLSSTRELQVGAEAALAEREVRRLEARLDELATEADAAALEALGSELALIEETEARRLGLERKLLRVGGTGGRIEELFDVAVRVERAGGGALSLGPGEDAPLSPGDLVSVVLTPLGPAIR